MTRSDLVGPRDVASALAFGRSRLQDVSPTPELDSQLILAFVLELTKLALVTDPKRELSPEQQQQYADLIERRRKREPVAYLTSHKEFWGLDFEVTRDVLIPRPDTELLVEMALTVAAELPEPLLALDLGTGTGCVPIALAFEFQRRSRNFFFIATDVSPAAVQIAKRNAQSHSLSDKIQFVCCNWSSAIRQEFDLIVSNPPYLYEGDPEVSPELAFEPGQALYAGPQGLDDYREIFKALPSLLSNQGIFLGEIGYGQAVMIEQLAKELLPHPTVDFHYDLRRVQRVVEIRLPPG